MKTYAEIKLAKARQDKTEQKINECLKRIENALKELSRPYGVRS